MEELKKLLNEVLRAAGVCESLQRVRAVPSNLETPSQNVVGLEYKGVVKIILTQRASDIIRARTI